ncbi:MAG: T9SS type A sorting domain-containing protein [Chitinophagales bacterium]|nr:T9SS type A sorting domain-containing protein [Chitinophagales bacterium]
MKIFRPAVCLLALYLLLNAYLKAQWVSIPDNNFATWLDTSGYSQCLHGNNTVGWQLDTTCPAVVGATTINCSNKNIHDLTGIQYFDNLTGLNCEYNQLTGMPELPDGLIYLYCQHNQLTGLPTLPIGLTYLICYSNQLTALPGLPDSLLELNCHTNQLSALPTLPAGLIYLYCGGNQLTSLPNLSASLIHLYCDYNQLNSLPNLPGTLFELFCQGNQLTYLPNLPISLSDLNCSYNQLSTIPALPDSLRWLHCNDNQLTILPQLPDTLYYFFCSNNPNLHCLPKLNTIRFFEFYNTGITCLPNIPQGILSSTPPLNTVELCEGVNANNCPVFWNISGNEFFDKNHNCIKDTGENHVSNIKVQLFSGGILFKEMLAGYGLYSFVTETYGTFAVSIDNTGLPFAVTCPANNIWHETITAIDSLHSDRNFGLECKPGVDLAAWSIMGGFVPANTRQVSISAGDASNFYNAHCATGVSGSVVLTFTGPVQFVSAAQNALTPTVNGNTLTWSIANFGNVNFFTDFNIVMHTDTFAQIGQQVCFTLTVNPISGDNNPANNVLTHCFTVVASFDPNDKQVYPISDIDTTQKELTYTIRFQNTGTAEAQHIYISDTLDNNIDVSTFQLLAYSHQPMVQIKENAVRFNFPNINLPDSNTNEPASHGYVQYKVKLKNNLSIGTQIRNTAYIYFDFNEPVITNTTTNTISINTAITKLNTAAAYFTLFPNPTNGTVTISIPKNLIGNTATVSDMTGRVAAAVNLTTGNCQLKTENFTSGIYFVTIGNATQKLIICK